MNIKCPNNLRMEVTKQGEIQALQSLTFEYHPTQNRNFNLSIFVPNVFQMAPKDIRNRGPWVPLAQKIGRREVYKTRQKTSIRKVRQYVKNVHKKGTPKSGLFVVFRGLEPKASQGGPKDPPEPLPRSKLVENCTKKGARNCISVMFY